MKYLSLFLFAAPLFGAFNVTVMGTSNTQAVLRVREYSGACTMTVRENDPAGAIHPDWNALVDSSHPFTTPGDTGEKFLVIGQKTGSLALKAATQYYYSISGCGTATGTFRTKPTTLGMIQHQQPNQNLSNYQALDYPEIDWTPTGLGKWYIHPVTGIAHKLLTGPEFFILMDSTTRSFTHVAGGTDWTNPANIANGSTSTARTTNQNPMYLYPNIFNAWDGVRNIENIGIVLWAHCESGSGADCDIEMRLFDDPTSISWGSAGTVTVRAGVASFTQQTTGASTVSAAAASGTAMYPGGTDGTNGFPRPMFQGWNTFRLTQDMYIPNGTVTANNSASATFTIASPTAATSFPRGMKAGQHVYIQGSGCTTNVTTDICTVATAESAINMTTVEALSGLGASVATRPLPWGVAIRKKTATTNTIRIGVQYRFSGHPTYTTGTNQVKCGPVEITRSDGVKGHSCVLPYENNSYWHWAFISNDGEKVVPINPLLNASGFKSIGAYFDASDPTIVYGVRSGGNLYKFVYSGDWGVTPTLWEKDPQNGGGRYYNGENKFPDPSVSVTLMLTAASVATQVSDNYPQYVAAPYPSTASFPFIMNGVSGDIALYGRNIVGDSNSQDAGPGQYAVFNINTGKIIDFIDAGTDTTLGLSFGESHTRYAVEPVPNTFGVAFNVIGNRGSITTAALLHGPHRLNIVGVWAGGAWRSNTCLQWPIGTGGTANDLTNDCGAITDYDKSCPAVGAGDDQIPQSWADAGAQGSNCVTLKISGSTAAKAICNEVGNAAGTNDDFAIFGACEWNAGSTWSGGPELKRGMKFLDRGKCCGATGDSDNFRVLTIAENGDGTLTVRAQRNASREKCCAANGTANPSSTDCSSSDGQMLHANNWSGMMVFGTYGSCNQSVQYVQYPPNPTSNAGRIMIETPIRLAEGHSGFGLSTGGGYRYIGATGARELDALADLNIQPPPAMMPRRTQFQGETTPIGGYYQQYISHGQSGTDDTWKHFSSDANHVNGTDGLEVNAFSGGFANQRPTFSSVAAVPDLWRVSVAGTSDVAADLKVKPVIGWCGPHGLTDISSPTTGNVIDTAPEYSFCVAYKDTQCRAGSTAGAAWVKCPKVTKHPSAGTADDIHTGLEFANEPSLLSVPGNAGFARRFYTAGPDMTGNNQMLVSDFFRPAGSHRAFWNAVTHPGGILTIATSSGYADGIRQALWLAKVPKFPLEGERPHGLKPVAVDIGARSGVTHARIKFGNTPTFVCNKGYATACYTDATLTPYAFSDDTRTATSCGSGCTLTMNVMPGEVLWYQIETSTDGTNFTGDPVQVMVP